MGRSVPQVTENDAQVAAPVAATPLAPRVRELAEVPGVQPPKDPSVVEVMHGQLVADPFRPLEDLDSEATVAWWKSQNERTQELLADLDEVRKGAIEWHEQIRDYTRESMAHEHGGNWFFTRQAGLDPQPTYYVRIGSPEAEPRVLIDPAKLSDDGTVALGSMDISPDGTLVAYTVSEAGSDWQVMRFRNVATGVDLTDELTGLRFTRATWDVDGAGVTYAKPLSEAEAPGKHFGVYHHTLGTSQADDAQLYKRPDVENSFVAGYRLEEDDPVLIYWVGSGTNPEDGVYLHGMRDELVEILPPRVASIDPFYRDATTLYAVTDLDAPRGRVVSIDIDAPAPDGWQTLVAESADPGTRLQKAFVADGKLLVCWSHAGADAIDVRELDGTHVADMDIPAGSTVELGQVRPTDAEFELSISGFLSPGTRYRYTVATNELTFVKRSDIPRDLTETAVVERIHATSLDGTKVPMWVIRPNDVALDGTAATILYGYGGFNIALDPLFSYQIAYWVEQGGVYAIANLRGGGEFGKGWYDGGRLANKQNTFDDFAACAEELIARNYTSPKRLGILGGSNGGLLTAVTSQQRPDLFGAVISAVPVTDMFRFQTDNYGAAWMSDYGDPSVAGDFAVSSRYSPLHVVRPADDATYPPTLVLTGDHDDRVAPWHAFKWTATRHAEGHADTTYLRVDERAGHGAGKPTRKVIEQAADEYAFYVRTLGPLRD